jgi:hypothetical protein
MGSGFFSQQYSSQALAITTHPHLALRLSKGRARPLTPHPVPPTARYRVTFTFAFIIKVVTVETWKKFVQFSLILKSVIKTVIITNEIPCCRHNVIGLIEPINILRNQ